MEKYPDIVRKLRKEVEKLRTDASKRTLVLLDQQEKIRALEKQKPPTFQLLE